MNRHISILIFIIFICVSLKLGNSLKQSRYNYQSDRNDLLEVLRYLSKAKVYIVNNHARPREYNMNNQNPFRLGRRSAQSILNFIRKHNTDSNAGVHKPGQNEAANEVEKELEHSVAHKTSAVLDKPYLEKKGLNDFLVMTHNHKDYKLQIVPNDLYYDVEKKCVNWLDNCSLKGLQAQLMKSVLSPYR